VFKNNVPCSIALWHQCSTNTSTIGVECVAPLLLCCAALCCAVLYGMLCRLVQHPSCAVSHRCGVVCGGLWRSVMMVCCCAVCCCTVERYCTCRSCTGDAPTAVPPGWPCLSCAVPHVSCVVLCYDKTCDVLCYNVETQEVHRSLSTLLPGLPGPASAVLLPSLVCHMVCCA
jgi:hypothetical protein